MPRATAGCSPSGGGARRRAGATCAGVTTLRRWLAGSRRRRRQGRSRRWQRRYAPADGEHARPGLSRTAQHLSDRRELEQVGLVVVVAVPRSRALLLGHGPLARSDGAGEERVGRRHAAAAAERAPTKRVIPETCTTTGQSVTDYHTPAGSSWPACNMSGCGNFTTPSESRIAPWHRGDHRSIFAASSSRSSWARTPSSAHQPSPAVARCVTSHART